MEAQLVSEFLSRAPGANPNDALSCLNSWGWDLKKALIDYNGKYNFFFCPLIPLYDANDPGIVKIIAEIIFDFRYINDRLF